MVRVPNEAPPLDSRGRPWWPPGWVPPGWAPPAEAIGGSPRRVGSIRDIFELLGLPWRPSFEEDSRF